MNLLFNDINVDKVLDIIRGMDPKETGKYVTGELNDWVSDLIIYEIISLNIENIYGTPESLGFTVSDGTYVNAMIDNINRDMSKYISPLLMETLFERVPEEYQFIGACTLPVAMPIRSYSKQYDLYLPIIILRGLEWKT